MRCMGLFAVPVLLIAGGSSILSKILRFMERSCSFHYADLSDDASLRRIFSKTKPDEFYHLAGQSHVGISFEIPEVTTQEIANCTLKLLEICRDQDNTPKVYLACSSEIFGNSSDSAQNENSPLNPTSPYGVAKAFCLHTGHIYRESYQLFVCNGILYNHESPRRGENFRNSKNCSWGSIYCPREIRSVLNLEI